ncbi:hypothetical protein [Streptomyces fractus]|uniref:hypothetical protein n=1 Tax=Streptomyces fractus TaxID=641806 RepID=UPI003CF36F7D
MARLGRPATGVTPKRNVRVPDALWTAAIKEAAAAGTSVTQWINEDLQKRVNAAQRKRAHEGQDHEAG